MTYWIVGRKKAYRSPESVKTFSIEEMRDQVTVEYTHRFITKAFAPYDFIIDHNVLWPKRSIVKLDELVDEENSELMSIFQHRYDQDYHITRNAPKSVSVPIKIHSHVMQLKDITDIAGVSYRE